MSGERCEHVSQFGTRCALATHAGAHRFATPADIPPAWWTPEETEWFVKNLNVLIANGSVAVLPATEEEKQNDPATKLGQLQIAACYVLMELDLLGYQGTKAIDRLKVLADFERLEKVL